MLLTKLFLFVIIDFHKRRKLLILLNTNNGKLLSMKGNRERTVHDRLEIIMPALCLFLTGAVGMVVEYVLSTISSYLNGSSVESFSLTIAIMLGMMGVGGWAQQFISDKNIIDKFVTLELILAVLSGFSPIIVYAAFTLTPEHYQFVYYLLAMSIGFLVGFEIPFITRMNESRISKLKKNLSIVFAADYIGAFIGACVWVYFLLPYMNIIQIGFVLSALNFLIASMTYCYFKRGEVLRTRKLVLALMLLVFGLLVYGFAKIPSWEKIIDQKSVSDPIVLTKKTPYQSLMVTHNKLNNDTRLYINGSTQFSSTDEARYHEALIHIPASMLDESPKNVLVLGGGDGMAVRELKKYEGINIDLIELDKDMFFWSKNEKVISELNNHSFSDFKTIDMMDYATARNKLAELNEQVGHRVFFSDANNFVNAYIYNRLAPRYDMVVIDLPDPYNLAINKMYTRQFYQKLNVILKEKGVIVTQSTSPFHAPKVFATIGKTIKESGYVATPYKHNIPSFGEWGFWIGSRDKVAFEKFRVETKYFTNELAKSSFLFAKNELLDDENLEVNSLMRPVLVRLYAKESWKVD